MPEKDEGQTPDPENYSAEEAWRDLQTLEESSADDEKPEDPSGEERSDPQADEEPSPDATSQEADDPETDDDVTALIARLTKDDPEALRAEAANIAKGVKQQLQNLEKERAAYEPYKTIEARLLDKATAVDTLGDLVALVAEKTGLSAAELLGSSTSPSVEILSESDLDKWEDLGFASRMEAVLKRELQLERQARLAHEAKMQQFLTAQAQSKSTEDWLTGNTPKVQRELETAFSGFKLSKDKIRQAVNGPCSIKDAVAACKIKYMDEIVAHVRGAAADPGRKPTMVESRGAAKARQFPSRPEDWTAAMAYEAIKSQL